MAPEPVLAREWDIEMNTGTAMAPTWTPVRGVTGITPAQTSTLTDDTDFDTDGWGAGTVVQRGRSLSVAMIYKEDPDTGLRDPGQEALLALGDAIGTAAKAQFRYRSPGSNGYEFRATVDIAWPGGEKTANSTVTAEIKIDGKPTPLPAPTPVVSGVVPEGGDVAGGTAVTVVGTGFLGTTSVKFGSTAATSVVVVNSTTITCVTPAHAAGAVACDVTTPGGTGTKATAYTYA